MHIDKRTYDVELHGIREENENNYSYRGEYTTAKLFCKRCESELTEVFNMGLREFQVNFCPHCGLNLQVGND